MSTRDDNTKEVHDRMRHEHQEALIQSGVEPREAERTASRVLGEAAELLERRRRERGE